MNSPLISIIIPIYNAEKYLNQCLDSVIAQTYTNWECLLVDDGSNDSSEKICDEYAEKDIRFRVFHKENGGVSSARNLGLTEALGEWVIFYDSDDLVPSNAILSFLPHMENNNIDSCVGNYTEVYIDNKRIKSDTFACNYQSSIEESLNLFFATYPIKFQGYLWNRIFRLSVIRKYNLSFDINIFYKEDGLFIVQYILNSGKMVQNISDYVYEYFERSDGAMGTIRKKFTPKYLTNLDARLLILKEIKNFQVSQNVVSIAELSVVDVVKRILVMIKNSKDIRITYLWYLIKKLNDNDMLLLTFKLSLKSVIKKRVFGIGK